MNKTLYHISTWGLSIEMKPQSVGLVMECARNVKKIEPYNYIGLIIYFDLMACENASWHTF